jgi:ATP-dependent protease ClpP protease subunit
MRNLLVGMLLFLASQMALSAPTLNPKRTIVISGPITGRIVSPTVNALDKLALDKTAPIDIVLSSPGGSLIAGYIIVDKMDALRAEGVRFRCVVRSLAASMAFQMLLHCDERYATKHAVLLWHPVRVFYQGALTSDMSKVAYLQMKMSDDMIRAELYDNLPMKKETIDWHFTNETLHHATQLHKSAKGFFKDVTSAIGNAFLDEGVALNTAAIGGFFLDETAIQYIHEQFIKEVEAKQ